MKLSKVNHIITAVMLMLEELRSSGVINYDQVNILLPTMVSIVLKNETVTVESE